MTTRKIKIRRLKDNGRIEFRKSLSEPNKSIPDKTLLDDDFYTEVIPEISVEIEDGKTFSDRHELGKYIHKLLNPTIKASSTLEKDFGMWDWISLLYINQLTNDGNKINRSEHYCMTPKGERTNLLYRHCIYGPYDAYDNFHDDMKIFLAKTIYSLGDCWEQMLSNNILKENRDAFEYFKYLYKDQNLGYAKTGSNSYAGKYPKNHPQHGEWNPKTIPNALGKIRRFKNMYRQLQVTKRIESHDMKGIKDIFNQASPSEF
jgi:hypothetical protein